MKQINTFKSASLCWALLFSGALVAREDNKVEQALNEMMSSYSKEEKDWGLDDHCDDFCNALSIVNLCAKKIKAKCIDTKQLNAREVCTQKLKANEACVQKLVAEQVCTSNLNLPGTVCAANINTNSLCAQNIQANDACIGGTLRANAVVTCNPFRASATLTADTVYTLGTFVPFNLVTDDPNGDISFVPNFHYTAPQSGYYMMTVQIDQHGLAGGSTILGVPVANTQIFINGTQHRQNYSPYLTFNDQQLTTYSTLLTLQAGDEVAIKYRVLVVDPTLGFTEYVGTVVIEGNGAETNSSLFKIIYLASDCPDLPCGTPCIPCVSSACDTCTPFQSCTECQAESACDHHTMTDRLDYRQ